MIFELSTIDLLGEPLSANVLKASLSVWSMVVLQLINIPSIQSSSRTLVERGSSSRI